jgi:FkbM family methyltransferase
MNLTKLRRLPKRLRQDFEIIRLVRNWRELLTAKARNEPFHSIYLRNGVTLRAPAEVSLDFLFHEIWLDEFYNGDRYKIMHNDVVIDIGANIGVFAAWAATRAENVTVFSYEPFPKNAEYFVTNLKASGLNNVIFAEAAVADSPGLRKLHVEDSWILHSLAERESVETGIEVKCVSLDMVLDGITSCHFLKLDCEGGEHEILSGASKRSMDKIQKIVCEYNIKGETRNGDSLANFLRSNGFVIDELRSLDPGSGILRARRRDA